MNDKFYLQMNIVNMITVVLMVAVGMALVGAAASFIRQYTPGPATTTVAG